jgi:hypothetical protein
MSVRLGIEARKQKIFAQCTGTRGEFQRGEKRDDRQAAKDVKQTAKKKQFNLFSGGFLGVFGDLAVTPLGILERFAASSSAR